MNLAKLEYNFNSRNVREIEKDLCLLVNEVFDNLRDKAHSIIDIESPEFLTEAKEETKNYIDKTIDSSLALDKNKVNVDIIYKNIAQYVKLAKEREKCFKKVLRKSSIKSASIFGLGAFVGYYANLYLDYERAHLFYLIIGATLGFSLGFASFLYDSVKFMDTRSKSSKLRHNIMLEILSDYKSKS